MMGGAFSAGAIAAKLSLNLDDWNKKIQSVKGDEKSLKGFVIRNSQQFKKMGKAMTIAGGSIVAGLGLMIKKASDAQETTSKFGTVFSKTFAKASEGVKDLIKNYGLSSLAAKDMMGSTGDLLTGLGMQSDAALDLSIKTQKLAVDLASFTNYQGGAKGASEALTKAMLGEREQIKSLGIVVTEEMVKEQLLKEGKDKLTGLALKQAKAEATLTLAMQQSKNAIGDYERTSGDLANVWRTLKGRGEDLMVALGTHLVPIITDLAKNVKGVVERVMEWVKEHPKLTGWIIKITAAVGGLMTVLGPLLMMLPGLAVAFTALSGPVGIVIGVIAGLSAAGFLVVKNWKKISKFLTGIWDAIKKMAVSVFDGIKKAIIDSLLKLANAIGKVPLANKLVKGWQKSLQEMRAELGKTEETVTERGMKMAQAFIDSAKKSDVLKGAVKYLGGVFKGTSEKSKDLEEKSNDLGISFETTQEKVKTWTDFLKEQGIKTIEEKRDRIKELEGYLGDLDKALADGKISLEDYKTATKNAKDEITSLKGETEGYIGMLKEYGILTIEEKQKRVEELKGHLDSLHQAYRDGKIDAEDYHAAVKLVKDEMDDLQTTIDETTIPAVRDMTDVWDSAVVDFKEDTKGFKDDFKKKTKTDNDSIFKTFEGVGSDIKAIWSTKLDEMISGAKSFKDALVEGTEAVFNNLKTRLVNTFIDMAKKWVTKFLDKIFSDTEGILGDISDAFGGLVKDVEGAATKMATAIGTVGTALIALIGYLAIFHGMPPVSPEKWPEWERGEPLPSWPVGPSPLGWQQGFEGVVREPITRTFGEIPEYVNIQPLSKIGGARQASMQTPNITIQPSPVNLYLNGERIAKGVITYFPKFSRRGDMRIHAKAITESI